METDYMATDLQRLRGKVCIINGAGGTIGEAVAQRFVDEGATVVGVDKSVHHISDFSLQSDLTDEVQVQEMYEQAFRRCGKIDVIYNNAGMIDSGDHSAMETSLATWQKIQEANLTSTFLSCKYGIPYLLRNNPSNGSVINSASFLATIGAATAQMSFSAAKAGIVQLTRDLGINLAKSGVRVNVVCFGPIETPEQRRVFEDKPDSLNKRLIHMPMGRFGTKEEAAGTAAFLACSDSGFITAAAIPLDGGITHAYTIPE